MLRILGICWLICLGCPSMGQRKSVSTETTLQVPRPAIKTITKEIESKGTSTWALGASTSTNSGIIGGIHLRKIWENTSKSQGFIGAEITNIKDYREFTSPFSYNGRTYVEGKLNQLLVFRPEYGRKWVLLKKPADGGPSLSGNLSTGPSIGIIKPYYVDISYTDVATSRTALVAVPMAKTFDNSYPKSYIVGESSMFTGLNESTINAGWHIKSALFVDIETYKKNHVSIELGFVVDYFSKPVDMLNLIPGRSVYTTGYLCLYLGKRN